MISFHSFVHVNKTSGVIPENRHRLKYKTWVWDFIVSSTLFLMFPVSSKLRKCLLVQLLTHPLLELCTGPFSSVRHDLVRARPGPLPFQKN